MKPTKPLKPIFPSDTNANLRAHLSHIRYLAVEGGGVCGFAYLAIAEWLHNNMAILGLLKGGVASSAGAIFLFLIALYRSADKIRSAMYDTDWLWFRGHYSPGNIFRLIFRGGGLYRTGHTRQWFASHLHAVGFSNPETLTMQEFVIRTGFDLRIMVTDEQLIAPIEISASTHPNFLLLDALQATMSIPAFWDLVLGRYSDGGSTYNCPMDRLSQYPDSLVLGLRVDSTSEILSDSGNTEPSTGIWRNTIIYRLLKHITLARKTANRLHVDRWHRVIRIDTHDVNFANFHLDASDKDWLVKWGYEAIRKWELKTEEALAQTQTQTRTTGKVVS